MDKKSNETVSVVVVTFGVKDYLWHCLDSLKAQSYPGLEIIVIDNSLNPEVSQSIRGHYNGVQVYASPRNLFYPGALNKGIEVSKGAFILCLNDDVVLDREFIKEALRGFCFDERIGMVSGKILRQDRKTIDSTGLSLSVWRTAKERGYGAYDKNDFEKEEYVFGVNGAVAFYRRKMLEEVKQGNDYLDSDYRFFYEDLDLAWRAQNLGWKGFYVPGALAYHVRGGSLRIVDGIDKPCARRYLKDSAHFNLIKNRHLTILKNETLFGFLLHFPCILLYDCFQWAYLLFCKPRIAGFFGKYSEYLRNALEKRKFSKKT